MTNPPKPRRQIVRHRESANPGPRTLEDDIESIPADGNPTATWAERQRRQKTQVEPLESDGDLDGRAADNVRWTGR